MPSKKSHKTVKKPAKTVSKKAQSKPASSKKPARPPTKAHARAASPKVAASPKKSAAKPVAAKPVATKPVAAKPAPLKPAAAKSPHAKAAPVAAAVKAAPARAQAEATTKFDVRPLLMPRIGTSDDEMEIDGQASSLLAGPRNVKPYIPRRGEQYMNQEQLEHFARILQNWKNDLMVEVDRTVLHMKDEAANFPDPNDRATQEEEFSLELRTRDRERKLIRKIDEALKRIEDGTYGYCLETGEEIGIKRLEARPVATLSVEAQERRERREKQYGDRDDRYR